jgi:hypothetical protein
MTMVSLTLTSIAWEVLAYSNKDYENWFQIGYQCASLGDAALPKCPKTCTRPRYDPHIHCMEMCCLPLFITVMVTGSRLESMSRIFFVPIGIDDHCLLNIFVYQCMRVCVRVCVCVCVYESMYAYA